MRHKTGTELKKPIYGWVRLGKKRWRYNQYHPTTPEALAFNINTKDKNGQLFLQPIKDWTIFKGDRVQVQVGKDKGKISIVNFVMRERNWVFVEGLNCRYKEQNKTSTDPGFLSREEQPLLVPSEVSLVDPTDNAPCEVEWRFEQNGTRVRVSTRSGHIIPLSGEATDYHEDFTRISTYKSGEKDTNKDELQKVTYVPKLKSFEEDILEKMGIKEDRKPGKTYWY